MIASKQTRDIWQTQKRHAFAKGVPLLGLRWMPACLHLQPFAYMFPVKHVSPLTIFRRIAADHRAKTEKKGTGLPISR